MFPDLQLTHIDKVLGSSARLQSPDTEIGGAQLVTSLLAWLPSDMAQLRLGDVRKRRSEDTCLETRE